MQRACVLMSSCSPFVSYLGQSVQTTSALSHGKDTWFLPGLVVGRCLGLLWRVQPYWSGSAFSGGSANSNHPERYVFVCTFWVKCQLCCQWILRFNQWSYRFFLLQTSYMLNRCLHLNPVKLHVRMPKLHKSINLMSFLLFGFGCIHYYFLLRYFWPCWDAAVWGDRAETEPYLCCLYHNEPWLCRALWTTWQPEGM